LKRNIEKPVLNKKQTCSLEPKKNHFYSSLVKQTRALWFSMVLQRTPHPQYGVERDHGHGDATTVENQYYKEFGSDIGICLPCFKGNIPHNYERQPYG
jgi:hypothetical protein